MLKSKLYAESSQTGTERGRRNKKTLKALEYNFALAQEMCKPQIAGVWESIWGWIMLLPSLLLSLGIYSGHCEGEDAELEKCLA